MSSRLVVLAVTIALASTARAQPGPDAPPVYAPEPDRYLALEPSLGGMSPADGMLLATAVAAWRHPGGESWLRVGLGAGTPVADVQGGAVAVRVGVEHRRALCLRGCFYAGLDLELLDLDTKDWPDETLLRAALAVARGGIDLGGDTVRFRIGIEISLGVGRFHDMEPDLVMPLDATSTRFAGGFAWTTALALRF